MAGYTPPGVTCQVRDWFAETIEDGTLIRQASRPPGITLRRPEVQQLTPGRVQMVGSLSLSHTYPIVARLAAKGAKAKTAAAEVNKLLVFSVDSALVFLSSVMQKDLDGGRHTYHPPTQGNQGGKGKSLGQDDVRNATSTPKKNISASTTYVGVVTSDKKKHLPVLRGDGFYTSTTSLQYVGYEAMDPDRYVDAETIPYLAVNGGLYETGRVDLGDYFTAVEFGKSSKAAHGILADVSPHHSKGECSVALLEDLGHSHGVEGSSFMYIIFPRSSGQPRAQRKDGAGKMQGPRHTPDAVRASGSAQFEKWGGMSKVYAVYPALTAAVQNWVQAVQLRDTKRTYHLTW
jgi:hypothetical protein